ncbi:MAG: hypothetical protein KDA24_14515 [Deltaproteobacteria bacterium]|nr:hypothetical protein [Deltaproteobacteria bacterium]
MAQPVYEIKKLEPDAFDTRLVERFLGEGRLNDKDMAKHLAKLEDIADQADEFEVVLGEDPQAPAE